MIISAALGADLALLTQALDAPGVDLAETVRRLTGDARTAAQSYLGLSVAITAFEATFDFTVLDEGVESGDVRTSLWVPLTVAAEGSGAVDETTSPASVTLVFYAATPGALIDLAADLACLTGRPLTDFRLDDHPMPASGHTEPTLLEAISTINQALGVLIEEGATPEQAERDLATRAIHAGTGLPAAAAMVVAGLHPPDSASR
ncbi:hypothetical protein [Nocardioides nematodiphilus]|uniref:hypothetical protein n=1 Tax=Nocardioides nematodiphilus TaxID=2849669 RepID=UPI001CD9B93B|nr:hypothetical protein [Nocardioides nematodiphilus]MCA1983791.1 hypothetical protein [Nocardioides nematodiphilus]